MHTDLLKSGNGPMTETDREQRIIDSILCFIPEVKEYRYSLVRALSAISLRLGQTTTENELRSVAVELEKERGKFIGQSANYFDLLMEAERIREEHRRRTDSNADHYDLLITSDDIKFSSDELKAADTPLKPKEEVLLDDIEAFIHYCVDNSIRFELLRSTLLHDINGILELSHGRSKPGFPRRGFSPKVSGYSKMDWNAWANDPNLKRENAAINAEFASSEADGIRE